MNYLPIHKEGKVFHRLTQEGLCQVAILLTILYNVPQFFLSVSLCNIILLHGFSALPMEHPSGAILFLQNSL